MAMGGPKRRLEALNLDEFSVVDAPANEADLLLVKRKEGSPMPKEVTVEEVANDEAATEPEDLETPDFGEVVKAVNGLADILKAKGKKGESDDDDDDDEKGKKKKTEKAADLPGPMKSALGKLQTLISQLLDSSGSDGGDDKEAKAKKSDDDEDVEKSWKRVSPERLEKVNNTLKEILNLLKADDDDDDDDKKGKDKKKGKGDDVKKALESVSGSLEAIVKRLESVEQASGVTSKVEKADGTDGGDGGKSIWDGVL